MISGVRSDVAAKLFGDDFDVLVAKGRRDRSGPEVAFPARRREHRAGHRPARPADQRQPGRDRPLRHPGQDRARPGRVARQQAAGRGRSKGSCVSRWSSACPRTMRASPEAIGAILVPTPPASASRCRGWPTSRPSRDRPRSRASGTSGGSPSRPTSAAATWAASSPRPSSKIAEQVALPPGRYRVECGGQFEHLQRARTRLMIVVPLAAGADLRAALPDLPQRHRRPARVHRRAVRLGRRHLRPVAARHAVLDLRGGRLHRPVRRRRARRHDPGLVHPPAAAARACRWTRR